MRVLIALALVSFMVMAQSVTLTGTATTSSGATTGSAGVTITASENPGQDGGAALVTIDGNAYGVQLEKQRCHRGCRLYGGSVTVNGTTVKLSILFGHEEGVSAGVTFWTESSLGYLNL